MEEFVSFRRNKRELFTPTELDSIFDLKNFVIVKSGAELNLRHVTGGGGLLVIYKFEDEWYTVYHMYNNTAYRCDQFEGLIKCLEYIS